MAPRAQGRMIKRDISNSNGFAQLSPNAAVLFTMLIPHFNAHGKLNGGPGFIKDEICPKIPYITYRNIPSLLKEITKHTNVKWFEYDGRHWIHSLKFLSEHQDLKSDRMGPDLLPDYSLSITGLVPPEVEEEVEDKDKGEDEGNSGTSPKVPAHSKNGKFKKPTLDEIQAYCEERKNGIDAQAFLDKYESNGWVIGKNKTPMKDWQATIRTWEHNSQKSEGPYRR